MICPHCRQPLRGTATVCHQCGTPLLGQPSKSYAQLENQTRSVQLPSLLQRALVLDSSETIIWIWHGSRQDVIDDDEGGTTVHYRGYLVASNQRIFFIRESGILKKAYSILDILPYETTEGFGFRKGIFGGTLIIQRKNDELRIDRLVEVCGSGKQGQALAVQDIQQRLSKLAEERRSISTGI